jgi:hypothetical protein
VVGLGPGHCAVVLGLCTIEDATAAQDQGLPENTVCCLPGQCNSHCWHAVSQGFGPHCTHQTGIPQLPRGQPGPNDLQLQRSYSKRMRQERSDDQPCATWRER